MTKCKHEQIVSPSDLFENPRHCLRCKSVSNIHANAHVHMHMCFMTIGVLMVTYIMKFHLGEGLVNSYI